MQWMQQAPRASVILIALITLCVVEQFSLITVSWERVDNSINPARSVSSTGRQVTITVERISTAARQVSTTAPSVPTAFQQISTTIPNRKRIVSTIRTQKPNMQILSTARTQKPKQRYRSTTSPQKRPGKQISSTVEPKKQISSIIRPQKLYKQTPFTERSHRRPKKQISSTARPKKWPKKQTFSTPRSKNWPKKRISSDINPQNRKSSAVQYIRKLATTGKRLSNLTDFRYLINNDVCGTGPVRILLATLADPRRPEFRQALRRALPNSVLGPLKVKRIFLLADASVAVADQTSVVSQELLEAENSEHHDLIQGNFLDTYRNLTYKSLMGLDWATTYCPQAQIIMKTDKDTGFDIHSIVKMKPLFKKKMLMAGYLKTKRAVVRNDTGLYAKWKVSKQDWPEDDYPPYASGGMYMLDMPLAARLLERSVHVPYFWIEDVFVTGILAVNQPFERLSLNRHFDSTWLNNTCTLTLLRSQNFTASEQSNQTIYRNPRFFVMDLPDVEMLEKLFNLYEYCFKFSCKVVQCHTLYKEPHKYPNLTSFHKPSNLTIPH